MRVKTLIMAKNSSPDYISIFLGCFSNLSRLLMKQRLLEILKGQIWSQLM